MITYAIDPKTKVCYHKFFSEHVEQDILAAFDAHDFPEIAQAMLSKKARKFKRTYSKGTTVEVDPFFGNVVIHDHKKKLKIELINSKPL